MRLLEAEHEEPVDVRGEPVGIGSAGVDPLIRRGEIQCEVDEVLGLERKGRPVTDERPAKLDRGRARGAPHGHCELLHAEPPRPRPRSGAA